MTPVFDALCPDGDREDSFVLADPIGAGHDAEMVHNGIEYERMQGDTPAMKALSALRNQFGGHPVRRSTIEDS